MQGEARDLDEYVGALRVTLAALARELESFEEWRALRQLDEREKAGSPLQSIDGVMVRGRLASQLAQKSRIWRAYVKIEAALGELRSPDVVEQSLLAPIAEVVAAAEPSRPALPQAAPAKKLAETTMVPVAAVPVVIEAGMVASGSENVGVSAAAVPPPSAAPAHVRSLSSLLNDDKALLDAVLPAAPEAPGGVAAQPVISEQHQRMRVKVRAASIALPLIVAAAKEPQTPRKKDAAADLEPESGAGSLAAELVAVDSEFKVNDRPLAKEALERIRPVQEITKRASMPEVIAGGMSDADPWGALAPDAPDLAGEGVQKPISAASDVSAAENIAEAAAAVVELFDASAVAHVMPDPVAVPSLLVPERVTAIEKAVAVLGVPEVFEWTAPLDVVEERTKPGKDRARGGKFAAAATEDDDQFFFDEADVEIVSTPTQPQAASGAAPVAMNGAAKKAVAEATRPMAPEELTDPPGYGPYHLDVEEASVEIIVKNTAGEQAPA